MIQKERKTYPIVISLMRYLRLSAPGFISGLRGEKLESSRGMSGLAMYRLLKVACLSRRSVKQDVATLSEAVSFQFPFGWNHTTTRHRYANLGPRDNVTADSRTCFGANAEVRVQITTLTVSLHTIQQRDNLYG
jgi:hypothetical protein